MDYQGGKMGDVNKIMYFLDFSSVVGGSNKILLTQAYIMKQKGFRVRMVLPAEEGRRPVKECVEICQGYGLETIETQYTIATCLENIDILKALKDCKEIAKLLKAERPDLVHCAQLNIAVELAARDLGIPHLINIYPADKEAYNLNWLRVFPQYHSADSRLFTERWGKGLGIPSRCIRVAYEVGECNRRRSEKKDYITAISIGVFGEHKNQLEILRFVLLCRDSGKDVKLVFLGDNNNAYGRRCREFVYSHNLQEYVKFEGFVLNIEDYLREADLFILASTAESYPGVIVESMANQVPIISTPVAGVPELLINEKNGFLTEGYGAKYIYDAFLRYLVWRENGLVGQIIENAYETYLGNHTYAAVGSQLEDYYRWIVRDYQSKDKRFITADQIETLFQSFVNENFSNGANDMSDKIWFLYHVFSKIELKDNKKIVIWGVGFWGNRIFRWIHDWRGEKEFIGFVDTKKQGEYMGYPIISQKQAAIENCGTIFVAIENVDAILEVMQYLESLGKVRNEDYFLVCNSPVIRI